MGSRSIQTVKYVLGFLSIYNSHLSAPLPSVFSLTPPLSSLQHCPSPSRRHPSVGFCHLHLQGLPLAISDSSGSSVAPPYALWSCHVFLLSQALAGRQWEKGRSQGRKALICLCVTNCRCARHGRRQARERKVIASLNLLLIEHLGEDIHLYWNSILVMSNQLGRDIWWLLELIWGELGPVLLKKLAYFILIIRMVLVSPRSDQRFRSLSKQWCWLFRDVLVQWSSQQLWPN